MSIVSLAWSASFKDEINNGKIGATVLSGAYLFMPEQELLLFVADEGNILEADKAKKWGRGTVQECRVMKVRELGAREARMTNNNSISELKAGLKKWYGVAEESVITFLSFKVKLGR